MIATRPAALPAADRSATLAHRPVLDGLRGVAVALVVAYHLWPEVVPGGFLGVDVFFVLSGFLISSLVLVEVERTGRLDLAGFYLRRLKRLLPALLIVVLAIGLYALRWAPPDEVDRLRAHSLWVLGYLANWRFIADGTTYTDVLYGQSPLRHTWSLAIEEQFYVLFPLVVLALGALVSWRAERLRVVLGGLAVAGTIASAAWMAILWGDGSDPSRGYFGTDTRVQSLLVGVVLGCLLRGRAVAAEGGRGRLASLGVWIGLVVVAAGVLTTAETSRGLQHGGFLLVAIGVALVIAGAERVPVVRSVLSQRPLVGLGLISYGVYLWHWPVIVIVDGARTGLGGWVLSAVRLAIVLGASLASYVLVEQPIRRRRVPRDRRVPAFALAALGLVVVGLTVTAVTGGRATTPAAALPPRPTTAPGPGGEDPIGVVMFGDSVAHSLAGGRVSGDFEPWSIEQSSYDPSRVRLQSIARISCSYLSNQLMQAEDRPGTSNVMLCGGWQDQLDEVLTAAPYDVVLVSISLDAGDEYVDGKVVRVGTAGHQALLDDFVDELGAIAESHGASVVLLANAPRSKPSSRDPGDDLRRARAFRTELQDYADRHHGVRVLNLFDEICPKGDCDHPAAGFQRDYRYDGLHYGPEGARWAADWITEQLEAG